MANVPSISYLPTYLQPHSCKDHGSNIIRSIARVSVGKHSHTNTYTILVTVVVY